jgi:hypothetical protein
VRFGPDANYIKAIGTVAALSLAIVLPSAAQIGSGPASVTSIGGHSLAPPPSVTSTAGRTLPNALPSVTSIPNYGVHYHNIGPTSKNYYGAYGRYYRGGGAYAYGIPYYYPVDPSAYGYDYVGGGAGPDLYSGPPIGPNDPTLHMIAEQPPADPYAADMPEPGAQAYAPPMRPPDQITPPPADVKPNDPTILVFRNGKKQEVRNYAIMGDSLYVFDEGRKKLALADLDLPATIKANDDRGVEFKVPASPKKKVTTNPAPQSTSPDQSAKPAANIASALP